ncbi:ABC transporter ATP-binding protein [Parafrankia sp. FMc6]|uniref:ABC transporter ATP-binding protein n=1 Tax=Parafrankia soli TaxID=2599596 RepID=UPI0034D500A0
MTRVTGPRPVPGPGAGRRSGEETAGELRLDGVVAELGGAPVLRGVTLSAAPGSLTGLVGPNGSGKTTLLRTVYRSLRPDAGAVLVAGADVWKLSARDSARRTAAVLQAGQPPAALTVAEVVADGRTPHHGLFSRHGDTDEKITCEALERTGALAHADRLYDTLSGGERQRVLLARALAQRPRLLVLDELTNHLDIRARFELLDLVRTTRITTLAVLHDLDLAVRYCDQLVVLDHGQVASSGPVLDALTSEVLQAVFGVVGSVERHPDGIVRITYTAQPLTGQAAVLPPAADEDTAGG